MKNRKLKYFFSFLFVLSIVATVKITQLYNNQAEIIFEYHTVADDHKFDWKHPFKEHYFFPKEKVKLHGALFPTPHAHCKGVIYYLHGRGAHIGMDWGKRAHFYTQHGYDMFILDYRMFGKSRGEIVESEIVDDCLHVYDWLADRYGEEKISVIGQSLGTGFATQVSAQRSPKQLILEAPYFSLLEQSYLEKPFIPKFLIRSILKYPIRTDQYISKVECPIYFIHGTADKLCPFNASERLHAMVKEGVETKIYPLEGWGHKHFPKNAHYHEVLAEIFGDELD